MYLSSESVFLYFWVKSQNSEKKVRTLILFTMAWLPFHIFVTFNEVTLKQCNIFFLTLHIPFYFFLFFFKLPMSAYVCALSLYMPAVISYRLKPSVCLPGKVFMSFFSSYDWNTRHLSSRFFFAFVLYVLFVKRKATFIKWIKSYALSIQLQVGLNVMLDSTEP